MVAKIVFCENESHMSVGAANFKAATIVFYKSDRVNFTNRHQSSSMSLEWGIQKLELRRDLGSILGCLKAELVIISFSSMLCLR